MKQATSLLTRIRELTRRDSDRRERGNAMLGVLIAMMMVPMFLLPILYDATMTQNRIIERDLRYSAQQDVRGANILLRTHLLDYRDGTVELLWPDEVPQDLPSEDNEPVVIGTISGFTADGTPVFSTAVRAGWDNYAIKSTTASGWSYIYDRVTSEFYKVAAPPTATE